ncbi:hypothetical protein V8C35DRAFT_160505 [Trichoderma chlorosporum]
MSRRADGTVTTRCHTCRAITGCLGLPRTTVVNPLCPSLAFLPCPCFVRACPRPGMPADVTYDEHEEHSRRARCWSTCSPLRLQGGMSFKRSTDRKGPDLANLLRPNVHAIKRIPWSTSWLDCYALKRSAESSINKRIRQTRLWSERRLVPDIISDRIIWCNKFMPSIVVPLTRNSKEDEAAIRLLHGVWFLVAISEAPLMSSGEQNHITCSCCIATLLLFDTFLIGCSYA